jgi:hypothetical protein
VPRAPRKAWRRERESYSWPPKDCGVRAIGLRVGTHFNQVAKWKRRISEAGALQIGRARAAKVALAWRSCARSSIKPSGHAGAGRDGHAALDYLEGKVITHTAQKHSHRQWLEFLKQIDREIPLRQQSHIILDDYSTHKHPVIKRWLARHPRFELHLHRPGSSRMNLVERFFRDLSQQAILPGSFGSVHQLVDAIMQYLAQHNLNPKRYVWRAKGEEILAKIQ